MVRASHATHPLIFLIVANSNDTWATSLHMVFTVFAKSWLVAHVSPDVLAVLSTVSSVHSSGGSTHMVR
jgi:hypothetical protein